MPEATKTLFELGTLPDVADFLGVSAKQLKYLLYVRNPVARYRSFDIPKRRGGMRTIRAPRSELKYIQRNLADALNNVYQPRWAVHGFRIGKSIVTNASLHCSSRYILNIDLCDFFTSVNFGRVRGLFLSPPFSLSPKVATILAQVCCHNNTLPQGAPSSPVLTNMICARMDGQLMQLAKRHRCLYSRYADDMTFSKRKADFPAEIGYQGPQGAIVGPELESIIQANGFQVNTEKVYLQSNRRRQRVTGLIVNKHCNVPRRFIRQVRAMIHAWLVYGEENAQAVHSSLFYRRTGRMGDPPALNAVIRGKLEFIRMVKGDNDPVYRNLQLQFVKVCPAYLDVMERENALLTSRSIFISHASEDKVAIAKPLADALIAAGCSVWYDEYEIKLGDSLLRKINEGLASSRFGVVILSSSFFSKNWPQKELDGLTALESVDGRNRVLPLWHGVTFAEVAKRSPILAGLKAADTSKTSLDVIVSQIMDVL